MQDKTYLFLSGNHLRYVVYGHKHGTTDWVFNYLTYTYKDKDANAWTSKICGKSDELVTCMTRKA